MTSKELLECLVDRPCEACKFHGENGCSKWNCVFDEKPDDSEEMALQYQKGYMDGFKEGQKYYNIENSGEMTLNL